ncbi:hypothetical protein [Bacteroides fragilis]|jgi:hypothetical protein|uniref:hypothetical protein n=1 Tax=Bacteroides fragilis TaxID=817 RepID=UPI000446AF33|nr:hypothetical protein [Bacteroides fragilis]EXZ04528.1 hypothetical protein M072_3047 [Bacteroides fragilis str. DS-208]MCE8972068.1 hypothetical protein [Bacteroides fragilis]WPO59342.1 hypothetical protein SGJ39_18430 [Bacteroides fragilis]
MENKFEDVRWKAQWHAAEVTVLRSRSYDGISFSGRHVHLIASKSAPYRLSSIPENSPMKTFA